MDVKLKIAAILLIVCTLGCDRRDTQERTISDRQTPVEKPFRLDKRLSSQPRLPSNLPEFLGVSGDDAPNDNLYCWLRFNNKIDRLIAVDDDKISKIQHTNLVDCRSYELNQTLRLVLLDSPKLRWLRLGGNASAADLNWISNLKQLKGLSLSRANLETADFQLLNNLEELSWLDIRKSKLPKPRDIRWPEFSKLEVLLVDSPQVDDDFIGALPKIPQLRFLSLQQATITSNGLKLLNEKCPNVNVLFLTSAKELALVAWQT